MQCRVEQVQLEVQGPWQRGRSLLTGYDKRKHDGWGSRERQGAETFNPCDSESSRTGLFRASVSSRSAPLAHRYYRRSSDTGATRIRRVSSDSTHSTPEFLLITPASLAPSSSRSR